MAKTRFIDLYAGIGGIRLGFQKAFKDESEFVFSNEIDQKASKTYSQNFNDDPLGDITKVNHSSINDFDILLAGFPCQAFSIAGKRKGLDDARGTHFFEVAKIIDKKRPTAFLLENVRHFRTHDSGKTFATLKRILTEDLNYTLYSGLLNAVDFGLPQNRNRFFMVGFKDPIHFEFPKPSGNVKTVGDILEKNVAGEYFLSQKYLDTLKRHRQRHEGKGNGFGYIVLKKNDIANTLVLGGMGRERNLIQDVVSLKKLESRARLQLNSVFAITGSLKEGLGCTVGTHLVMREELERGELHARPITSPELSRTIYLCEMADRPATFAREAVMSLIYNLVAEAVETGFWRGTTMAQKSGDWSFLKAHQ